MLTFDELYSWVKDLPIIDWHNHLDLGMIAADKPLGSLYEVWVKADPYKHRAMRICGESESVITGGGERTLLCVHKEEKNVDIPQTDRSVRSPEEEGWAAWMRTLPKLVGNPLFAWARMELEFLGLDPEPYLHGWGENVSLADWTPRKLLRAFNVETLCPCAPQGERTGVSVAPGERTLMCVQEEKLKVDSSQTDKSVRSPGETDKSVRSPGALLREFSEAMARPSAHFCSSLVGGDGHRRNLPHIAHDGGLIFLTFRLADSLPAQKLAQFAADKESWLNAHPKPWTETVEEEYDREFGERIDAWLDSGVGSCLLRDPSCRQAVVDALEKFNDTGDGCGRYVLHSYVIMPNHVHVLFELKDRTALASVVQGWKGVSARCINLLRQTQGTVWQSEYFDRLIRNAEHYARTVAYIRRNEATENGHSCPFGKEEMNAQECAFSLRPSLRMNAGEVISAEALESFDRAGCRVVDISVDDDNLLEREFDSLVGVAAFARAHGWTMLLHLGALRATSARLRAAAGPAGGFAGMHKPVDPARIAAFLNRLEQHGERTLVSVRKGSANAQECAFSDTSPMNAQECAFSGCPSDALPRTILLSLNPEAHAQLAVLAGSFNGEGMPGKVQLGPAWWWCDHEEGIRDVLEKNAAYGVLSTFVGMTTDSRSLLSFVRHDYFRRILCQWTAEKIAAGAFPDDAALIRPLLENICYRNAKEMVK